MANAPLFLVVARPRHEHDCDKCQLVGLEDGADLYYCPPEDTYIARRSSDGPDYQSTPAFLLRQFPDNGSLLYSARRRHQALKAMLASL